MRGNRSNTVRGKECWGRNGCGFCPFVLLGIHRATRLLQNPVIRRAIRLASKIIDIFSPSTLERHFIGYSFRMSRMRQNAQRSRPASWQEGQVSLRCRGRCQRRWVSPNRNPGRSPQTPWTRPVADETNDCDETNITRRPDHSTARRCRSAAVTPVRSRHPWPRSQIRSGRFIRRIDSDRLGNSSSAK